MYYTYTTVSSQLRTERVVSVNKLSGKEISYYVVPLPLPCSFTMGNKWNVLPSFTQSAFAFVGFETGRKWKKLNEEERRKLSW